MHYVPRQLSWSDKDGKRVVVEEAALGSEPVPVVVLGDPGMGKSELLRRMEQQQGYFYLTAAQFLRRPTGHLAKGVLLLDALDELSAGNDGDPLERVLARLGEAGWPDFILSCRAADWRGSTRAQAIAEDYGQPARVLILQPLQEHEGLALLERKIGASRASAFHQALAAHRLTALLGNPQTLNMLIEVAEDGIPRSRADLFERAARKMIAEHNPQHVQSELNRLDAESLLDGAGAAMAMLLLAGKEGLFNGLQAQTPEQFEHVARVAALPLARCSAVALKSRLFRVAGEPDTFKDCHRTVAEYLGARWLGRVTDASGAPQRMVRRVLALICSGGRVPASLRGLHAWLAHASPHFAGPVIAADPYGVLRYGDLGDATPETARLVWESLERRGEEDPWFRGGDWQQFSVAALVQEGLGKQIARVLANPRSSFHLRSLALDLLQEGDCVPEMQSELVALVTDASRPYSERHDAMMALAARAVSVVDWPRLLTVITAEPDEEALRLTDEIFTAVGFDQFDDAQVGDHVLQAYVSVSQALGGRRLSRSHDFWSMAQAVPLERCAGILDALAERFGHGTTGAALIEHQQGLGDLAWSLIARQIPTGSPDPVRLWRWLDAFAECHPCDHRPRAVVAAWLAACTVLRQEVQSQIFLTAAGTASRRRSHWRLASLSNGLCLQEEDVLALIGSLIRENRRDSDAQDLFKTLVRGLGSCGEWTERMTDAAEIYAAGDPALQAILHPVPEDEDPRTKHMFERLAARQREADRKRAVRQRADRDAVLLKRKSLREGRGPAPAVALCFLGYRDFKDRELEPEERIEAWLGDDIRADALAGFEASLRRPLGASLHEITRRIIPRERDRDPMWPVVAGLAARHRHGRGFDGVSEDHVLAALIAKQIALSTVDKQLEGFREALEAFAMAKVSRFERFLRALVEPQLGLDRHYITGTHYVLGGKEHRHLRARLLLEWADAIARCFATDREALVEGLLNMPPAMQEEAGSRVDRLIAEAPTGPTGEDRSAYWTALRIVRDFAEARDALESAAEDREFLWSVQKAIGHDRFGGERIRPLAPERLAWIFERFCGRWPNAERPRGTTTGSRNPWDASEFLGAVLFRLADDTSPEAMRMLHRLAESGDASYGETLRAARARQCAKAAEQHYIPHDVASISAAVREVAPMAPQDVKAVALDAIAEVQVRLLGSATDTIDLFYEGGKPKNEERCRNALLDLLGPILPFGIVWAPEERMPSGKRADAGFRLGGARVPLEAKLAWNPTLWTACIEQLDRLYASADHLAGGHGIYVVFWFGPHPPNGRPLPLSPEGSRPESPAALEALLSKQLIAGAGDRLSIVVLDLARAKPQPV
jgi:hypothetical protein